jgi:hypothetical protein
MQNQPAAQDVRKSAEVLPFQRRAPTKAPAQPLAVVPLSGLPQNCTTHNDFAHFEQDRDEPLNERQRMLMNLIAVGVVVALISVGVWIADSIQVAAKTEDCFLQGRTNCAPIDMSAQR